MARQVATHFPKDELLAFGNLTVSLRTIAAFNDAEFADWTVLWTIVGPGRRLATGEEAQLRQALSRASYRAKLMRVMANQMLAGIRRNKLLPEGELARVTRETEAETRKTIPKSMLCQPIGDAPQHYGGSPFKIDMMASYKEG